MSNEPKEGSVTAPQEPLKPTMFLLTRTTWTDSTVIGLYFDKTKARAEADRLEAAKGQGDGWQEYYVNPIVVADATARDDAAELRAALERFKAWADRWEGAVYAGGIEAVMGTGPARKELLIAMNRASAALAATEGRGEP